MRAGLSASVLVGSAAAALHIPAQQIAVNVGAAPTVQISPGSMITVPIIVDLSGAGSADIASLQGSLGWNANRLTFDSLRMAVAGWTLTQNTANAASGSVNFATFNATALPATMPLLNAYFTAGTAGGTRVQLQPTAVGNEAAESILPIVRPGRLDVCVAAPGKWGDVTGDAAVNIVDAQQIARFAVGLTIADPVRLNATGDVTSDGLVNIVDAQQVARFAVSLPAATRVNTDIFTPPQVGSISLTPSIAQEIQPAAALQVTPLPRDPGGVDVSGCAGIDWTSSNAATATVSASGLVTAVAPGATTIMARSVTTPATAASLPVTVPGVGPPPVVFFTESFDDSDFNGRSWYDNKTPILSTVEKHAGASALELRFPAGAQTPVNGGAMRRKFAPSNSVYISYWVKYSDNWIGSGVAYHPHEFHVLSNLDGDYTGLSHTFLTVYLEHSYQNGGRPRLAIQDNRSINTSFGTPPVNLTGLTETRSVSGCNGILESNLAFECYAVSGATPPWYNSKHAMGPVVLQPNPGTGYKGNWNRVEAYFQMNTVANGAGQTDGIMRYWLNGQLIINRQDIIYRTAAQATLQFQQFVIAHYLGPGSPVEQTLWVDDLIVASGRTQ